MSHRPRPRSFWFHGQATVFAGRLDAPVIETFDVLGSSALPAVGGFASATVQSFSHRGLVGFERGSSAVAGRASDHGGRTTWDTLTTATIEGLDIMGVVTADRVVARLVSVHPPDHGEPEILPVGSSFENLRIAGIPVELPANPELHRQGTYAGIATACAGQVLGADGAVVPTGKTRPLQTEAWQPGEPSPVFEDRLLLTPLFSPAKGSLPSVVEASGPGWVRVAGFGTVFFGEYLVSRFARRLTMLRVELGCPVAGTLVAGDTEINGHIYP